MSREQTRRDARYPTPLSAGLLNLRSDSAPEAKAIVDHIDTLYEKLAQAERGRDEARQAQEYEHGRAQRELERSLKAEARLASVPALVEALRSMEESCPDCGGATTLPPDGKPCAWCGASGFVLKPADEVARIRHQALAVYEQSLGKP